MGTFMQADALYALNGVYQGIDFRLISSDFLYFNPIKIEKKHGKNHSFFRGNDETEKIIKFVTIHSWQTPF